MRGSNHRQIGLGVDRAEIVFVLSLPRGKPRYANRATAMPRSLRSEFRQGSFGAINSGNRNR